MIEYISGILLKKESNYIIVDVNGIGYKVSISLNTYDDLPMINQKVSIDTFFHVTENNQSFARHLRLALPYFDEFQGQILVFHLGVFPAPEVDSRIIEDLVLLNRAGLQIILVHGPGEPSIFSDSPSESRFDEIRRSIASAN